MAQEEVIEIRARIDFDKANSIKQVDDIAKYAEKNLDKVLSRKKQSKNLKLINNEWHELVDYQNKFYEIIYSKDRRKKTKISDEALTPSQIKNTFGINKEELDNLAKAQRKEIKIQEESNSKIERLQNEKLKNQKDYKKKLDKLLAEYDYYSTLKDYEKGYKEVGILNKIYGDKGVDVSKGKELFAKLETDKKEKEEIQEEENFEKTKLKFLKEINKAEDKKIARIKSLSRILGGELLNTKTLAPSLSKLVNTIKRVGFYRIARNIFRYIENGFKKGISDLVQFDEQSNKTMSSLATSFDKITASFTLVVMPLMDIIEPIISELSNSIASFAENISAASASMKGLSTYTKLNKNYMRDLANEANSANLSFDKFESLNMKDSMYIEAEITEEQQESAKKYVSILEKVKSIISNIIETVKVLFKTIEPYIEPIIDFILGIIDGVVIVITKIIQILDKLGILKETLYLIAITIISMKIISFITNIVNGVSSIIKFIKLLNLNLQTTSSIIGGILVGFAVFKIFDGILQNAPKWVSALTMIAGAVALVAVGLALAYGNYQKALAIPAIMASAATMFAGLKGVSGINGSSLYYENQSLPTTSAITNTPSIENNNAQNYENTMISALNQVEETKSSDYGDIVLNLDGAEIARSKRFNTEMNIRNASLNLR